jgi:LruC domain-containing protein
MKTSTAIKVFIGIALSTLYYSCIQTDDFNTSKKRTAETFDYSMTKATTIQVSLADLADKPVEGVVLNYYTSYPYDAAGQLLENVTPVAKALTKADGSASTLLDLPTVLSEVYVVTNYPGYNNPDTVNLVSSSSTQSLAIHPAGYQSSASSVSKKSASAKAADVVLSTPYSYKISGLSDVWVLGSFDETSGLPNYIESRDVISSSLKANIAASLPESKRLPDVHPEYLENYLKSNLKLIDDCKLWVTFVSEGAGYQNVLGYFYYPTNTPPEKVADIAKKVIVFPNSSASGSGGALVEGDKVRLMYFNENTQAWTDVFPKGLTVSWFLIANGYSNKKITNGLYLDYSLKNFNKGEYQQNIILYDKSEEKMVIGFEDVSRSSGYSSDNDFNDAVYYATANPITAVETDDLNEISEPEDADNDGVLDTDDEYPNDPNRAFNKYTPGKDTWGTLVYEDLWPSKGDYDFNDLVSLYNFKIVTNASGKVVDINGNFRLKAQGAANSNGFAMMIKTSPSNVNVVNSSAYANLSGRFSLQNGLESGQSYAVVPIVDDIKKLYDDKSLVNTVEGGNTHESIDISISLTLNTPVAESTLGTAPYNPFLIAEFDQTRGKEIHLSGFEPSSLANVSLFGTSDDLSDVSSSKFYVADLGFPWALKIPAIIDYPKEQIKITDAFLKFSRWAETSGSEYSDWYLDKTGYRDESSIYLVK